MTIAEKRQALAELGFDVCLRDPNLNTDYPGAFMIADYYEPGTTTRNASVGPWCIVGDDLDDLVREAYDFWIEDLEGDNILHQL